MTKNFESQLRQILFNRLSYIVCYFGLASFAANGAVLDQSAMESSPVSVIITTHSNTSLTLEYNVDSGDWYGQLADDEMVQITRWIAVSEGAEIGFRVDYSAEERTIVSADRIRRNRNLIQDETFLIGEKWTMRGIDIYPLIFNPISYNPSSSEFQLISRFKVELTLPHNPPPLHQLNQSILVTWGDLLLNDRPPLRDEAHEGAGYVYVVPADEAVHDIMEDLYEWRRLQGFNIIEYVLPGQLHGGISGEQLYATLHDMHRFDQPIEYICLVGDTGGDFIVPTTLHGTSDYHFALLEGDDPLPDAAVGRLSYNSLGELRRIVRKILEYEREPDLENMEWLRRGAVIAGNEISGLSTILVSKWVRDQMLSHNFTRVDTLWYTMGDGVEESFRRSMNSGISYISYRGWTGLEDFAPREALQLANPHLPVALLLGCSTGDYDGRGAGHTEALLRAEGGAIGAIGNATLQSRVNYNNALMAGFFKHVLDGGVYKLGWMLNAAKLELFATYGAHGRQNVISHAYWANLMGDPGTIIWRGIPREVEIEFDDEVIISHDPVEVVVTHNNDRLAGVQVGLFKVGELITSAITNENGVASLSYNPLYITEGEAFVTATGDRILPVTENIVFVESEALIAYNDYSILDAQIGPLQGNGDGIIQPFEVFELNVIITNIGQNPINAPIAMLLSTEHGGIIMENPEVVSIIRMMPGDDMSAVVVTEATGSFPDKEDIPFTVTVSSGESVWTLPFNLSGEAPRMEIFDLLFNDPDIIPGADLTFDIWLINNGSVDIDRSQATLESMSDWAVVFEGEADYDDLRVGELGGAGDVYVVGVDLDTPWGENMPFQLIIESEAGITETIDFSLNVDPVPNRFPTGPDEYGYWAIESSDAVSNIRPVFNWVELNPELNGGPGVNTGLVDTGEDDDKSTVLRLPFAFKYYGEEYDRLTVCTNGWAAFGEQNDYIDFRNLPIGSPQGPTAQLCPWWDDLHQPGAEGGVFYWFDSAQHRFIVEWYRMRRYVGPSGPGEAETFQLILHDPDWYATYTGDGDIIFQYQDTANNARVDAHGTPYATIGIGNSDDSGGLQISYWNQWAIGSSPIGWHSAIRFSTSAEHRYGELSGSISSIADGQPIAGATVRASTGAWVTTNDLGRYDSLYVLADLPFTLIASHAGFNDVESFEMQLEMDQQEFVEFRLPNPLIALNVEEIADTIDFQDEIQHPFEIINDGNGDLIYQISFLWLDELEGMADNHIDPSNLHRDDPDELWDAIFSWNVTQATGDHRISGAVFNEDVFAVSGGTNDNQESIIYIFDRDGEEVRRIEIECDGIWGFRDLGLRNGNIYGGCRDRIFVIGLDGPILESIESPLVPPRGLTVEPDGDIWVVNDGDPIHHLDPEGNIIGLFPHRLRPYGLAWHPAEIDGYPLYIFSADGETNMAISKMDPETGDIRAVTVLELEFGDRAGGCEFTLNWDTRRWTLITVIQNPDGDRVELFDAGPNLSWINVDPVSAVVPGGQNSEVTLTMSSDNLDRGQYQLDMIVSHNAIGDDIHIPIHLRVGPQVVSVNDQVPDGFTLNSIFPNPANSSTRINFSLANSGRIKISVWDSSGRKVSDMYDTQLRTGEHSLPLNGVDLSSGIYIIKLELNGKHNARKFVFLK